jgi:hypothetical protein
MKILASFERKTPGERILHILVSLVFAVVAFTYVYMFFWAVMSACKTHTEIIMNPFALPKKWHWDHFIEVVSSLEVNGHGFWEMLFNSCFFSVGGALLQTFVTITFAYCCTMYKFPGSNLPYTIILVIMTLPIYGAGGATYALYRQLGMVDSYTHIICSAAGMTGSFLYFRAFFKNMSWTYAEAAAMEAQQRLIDAEEALADARETLKREEAAYADAQTRARREMGANEAEASILQLDLDAISGRLQELETVRADGYAVTAPTEGVLAGMENGSFAMTNPYGGNLLTFSLDEVDAAFLTARTKLVISREEQKAEVSGCTQNEGGDFFVPVVRAGWEAGTVTVSGILWEESYDVCVPVEALRRDSGGHFLFVLDRRATLWNIEQTVRKVYVYPERMDGAFAAVTGLEPGYLVVVTSSKPLTEGSRIRVMP